MALLISKEVSIVGGVTVPQLYIRLFLTMDYNGNNIYVNTETYISKDAYLNGQNNSIRIPEIPDSKIFKYDRNNDGIDVLLVAHNKLITLLSTDEMLKFPKTDPSTGEYILDTNKNIIMDEVISNTKFVEKEEIEIVDLD